MGKATRNRLSNAKRAQLKVQTAEKSTGRPRNEGPRYACGKLKPPAPNDRVIELRRAMLGNSKANGYKLAAAENPIDLAHARKWLNDGQRDALYAYRNLYEIAGPAWSASLLKVKVADLNRSGGGGRAIDNPQAIAQHALRGHPGARDDLHTIWGMLKPYPARQAALNALALRGEWPRWLVITVQLSAELKAEAEADGDKRRSSWDWTADEIRDPDRLALIAALGVVQSVLGMVRDVRTHPFGEPIAA